MEIIQSLLQQPVFVILIVLWELILKGIALWKSAKANQKYWFVALLSINSIGILPLVYLTVEKLRKTKKDF